MRRLRESGRLENLTRLSHRIFSYALLTYIFVLLAEVLSGIGLSSTIGPNLLLVIVLGSGIVAMMTRKIEDPIESEPLKIRDYLLIAALGIAVAITVWYGTQAFYVLSYLISIASGAIAVSFSMLLHAEGTW